MILEISIASLIALAFFKKKKPATTSDAAEVDTGGAKIDTGRGVQRRPTKPARVGRTTPTRPATKPATKPARVGRDDVAEEDDDDDDPRATAALTNLERTAAVIVCKQLPTTLAEAPAALSTYVEGTYKPFASLDEWLAFVTFASCYILSASPWVSEGNDPAPWGVVPGWGDSPTAGATWRPVYLRILAFVKTLPKKLPAPAENTPAPLPEENPLTAGDTPTPAERAVVKMVAQQRIDAYPNSPNASQKTKAASGVKWIAWLTSVAYWYLYADPQTSDWQARGGSPAPWKLAASDKDWIAVYNRIQKLMAEQPNLPADKMLDVDTPPTPTVASDKERTAARSLWSGGKYIGPKVYEAAPEAGMRVQGTRSDADWAANVVYWYLYCDPTVQQTTYDGSPWSAAKSAKGTERWKRIRAFIATLPGGK